MIDMLKELAIVKGPAGDYHGKTGIIVAIRDEQRSSNEERSCSYKLLVDGQISGWVPSEWLEFSGTIPSQDEAM